MTDQIIAMNPLVRTMSSSISLNGISALRRSLLENSYEYLENLLKEEGIIIVVGFNILRFDIPLIIQKSVEYRGSLS
jgi:uncharacterized protein YprB with RNaseH-like and TPR domain